MRVSTQMQYQSRAQMEESKVYKEFMKKQAEKNTEVKDKDGKVVKSSADDNNTEAVKLGADLEITKKDGKMVVSQGGLGSKSVQLKEYDIKSEIGKQLADLYAKKDLSTDESASMADELTKLNSSIKSMSLSNYL